MSRSGGLPSREPDSIAGLTLAHAEAGWKSEVQLARHLNPGTDIMVV